MVYSGTPGETWITLHLSSPVWSWVPGEPLEKPAKIPGNKQLLPGNLPAVQICARDGFSNYQLQTIPGRTASVYTKFGAIPESATHPFGLKHSILPWYWDHDVFAKLYIVVSVLGLFEINVL